MKLAGMARKGMMAEKELFEAVELCRENGRLNPAAVGWSRRPLHRCNLHGRWPRKKRWNYWAVTNEHHLFSVTVSDVDYAGLVFVYLADFEAEEFTEVTLTIPLGRGIDLAEEVAADVRFEQRGVQVALLERDGGVDLRVRMDDFEGARLAAAITVHRPPGHETLNVVIPWDERTFQFTSKQNALPAEGVVTLDGKRYEFGGEQSFACLDFGRGIWPRESRWNWGSAAATVDGRTVGLNLGGQWTDGTGYTENGICVDGRLSKIGETLRWEYDRQDWLAPWRITSPSRVVDLTFLPMMERVAKSDLWLVKSEVHQIFGHYVGSLRTAEGEEIAVPYVLGWAEDHVAVW